MTGNLNSRGDSLKSKSESFTYDTGLDRLLSVTGPQNLTMTYNTNGNISTKSDIGSVAFGYGTGAGPYALTGVTSSTSVIPATNQTATYTSFEKVNTLFEVACQAYFSYNADQQRAKMSVTQSGTTILTRWYAGSSYMKETAGGVTKEYTYIGGDAYSAPVAAVTQSGVTNYYYLLRDYLGNITQQVNTSNTVVAEYSFDAWGRRRKPNDWSYTLTSQPELFADRGFTGHEWLKYFNLYNMNGRLYDPLVGRFLSADVVIQDPSNTQNYNRYSYCLNNPLKYTDPSGYLMEKSAYQKSMDAMYGEGNYYYRGQAPGDWGGDDVGGGGSGGGHWETVTSYVTMNAYVGVGNSDSFLLKGSHQKKVVNNVWVANYGGGGIWGDRLHFTEKHLNGGLGTVGVSVLGYNNLPNSIKRTYAYKLSKITGIKAGQIFQKAKGFANTTGKLVSKLGTVGAVLQVGVIYYEASNDKWNAHTYVNGTLLVGAGVATFFAAPAVLTGIAVYGVGDYFFDFGRTIDKTIGRDSQIWEE